MTTLTVEQAVHPLRGCIRVPGDKSISHRALILAALADGESRITGLSTGEDVVNTAKAVCAMGATVEGDRIHGGRDRLREPAAVIDVGNSGTGIRLLAGMTATLPWLTVLSGDASIATRPMDRVVEPLRRMGATIDGRDNGRLPPLVVRGGTLEAIDYEVPVPSAQVKGSILLAGLNADGATTVRERVATRAHTEELLALAGADVTVGMEEPSVTVKPGSLSPFELEVPGDPSQAAFWIVAALLVPGSEVTVERVYVGPGRDGFIHVLQRMGGDVVVEPVGDHAANVTARYSDGLRGTVIEGVEVPGLIDEVPVLAVAAALADGPSGLRDAAELRVKESDRIATTTAMLAAFGSHFETRPDGFQIAGGTSLSPAAVDSHGDHRIAMAAAVAALVAPGQSRIDGWDAVRTSYPGFEDDLRRLQQ